MKSTTEVKQVASALTSWISSVSTDIEDLSRIVASQLEKNLAGKPQDAKTALDELDILGELSREFMTRNSYAVGAGVFFDSKAVESGSRTVEWWYRKESGAIERLDFDTTPGSQQYYDYEKLPFFSTAASTGKQTLWGPYVDYLGCEEYVLSFAAPFSVRGNFAGVAEFDIRIKDLEAILMPALRGITGDAAIVSASNRVILGNSGMYLVGERIKSEAQDLQRLPLEIPHLELSLIYSPEAPQS